MTAKLQNILIAIVILCLVLFQFSLMSCNRPASNVNTGEIKPEATEESEKINEETVPEEETPETEETGYTVVINVIEITDPLSGVVYDALTTDVPAEWMNKLPASHELQFHLEVSDPDGEDMVCWLSDSRGNNYEPIPADNGNIDFYWTSPEDAGELTMKFLIKDKSGIETVKELNFTFIEY